MFFIELFYLRDIAQYDDEEIMALKMCNASALLQDVTRYWDNRAESYSDANIEELESEKRYKWQQLILQHAPEEQSLKVLDIGTGPGFFAIIMAQAGHQVTGVDATAAMLERAKNNAQANNVDITLVNSDVHELPFSDQSFDLIISRNVTWNLKNPAKAYQEWHRVLKNKGHLVNFDANWYLHLFNEQYRQGFKNDRNNTARLNISDHYVNTDTRAMEAIARQLPLSQQIRPQWDAQTLLDIGFNQCLINRNIGEYLWDEEEKINYGSTPMFMLTAQK